MYSELQTNFITISNQFLKEKKIRWTDFQTLSSRSDHQCRL